MESEKKKELGAGRVAFLARKDAIKERIETGRTVMSVYREVGPLLGISYSQFDRYVNKFIKEKPTENKVITETPVIKGKEKELSTYETMKQPIDKKDMF
ncbi:MAG: TraK family protein [bacterium]|nr:TraK family protein [bacterium]